MIDHDSLIESDNTQFDQICLSVTLEDRCACIRKA